MSGVKKDDAEFDPGMIIVTTKHGLDSATLVAAVEARGWTVLDVFGLHVVIGVPVGEEKAAIKAMKARDDVEDAFLNVMFHGTEK